MRRLLLLAALCGVFGAMPASAPAITGGQPDGNGHPYVAYLDNGVFACSGTLLSPTVLITAAQCFSDSTSRFGVNSVTDAPIVRATFDPNFINTPRAQRVWFFGSYYFDPQFALGSGGGLPGFDTHDLAVVIKYHVNKGGTCFGDSGGPDLLEGTNISLADNSFVTNGQRNGVAYSYRIDTPQALSFINSTVAARGGSL